MSKFTLAYDNVADLSTIVSSGTYVSTLPLINLKTNDLSEKARTTTTADFYTSFTFTTIEDKAIGAIAICEHNFSSSARVRIDAYKGGSLVYSTPYIYVWPYLDQTNSFWQTYTYTLQPISGTRLKSERANFIHFFPNNLAVDTVYIYFTDGTNPDGYIEMARVFIGTLLTPKRNINFGEISLGIVDNSEVQLTRSKSKKFHELRKQRTASLLWSSIDKADALGELYTLQKYSGLTKEVLFAEGYPIEQIISSVVIYDSFWFSTSFMGNISELTPLNYVNLNLYSNGLRLEEVI